MSKRASLIVAILVVASLVLSGCSAPEPQVVEKEVEKVVKETVIVEKEVEKVVEVEKPEDTTPKGTVVVGVWQEPKGLIWNIFYDAHANDIIDSIFYSPVTTNEKDELVPEMLEQVPTVENGGVSEDGKTITLKFKPGFTWHDGQPVTAEDYKFTWQFIMDPATASQTTAGWNMIQDIEVVDDLTAVVTLTDSYVPFVAATLVFPILPKHCLEGVSDPGNSEYARAPIGNGPFMFKEWISGGRIVVVANPTAPIPPKLESIVFQFVPDMNTLLALLRTGDVDVAYDLRETQIPELVKMQGVDTVALPGLNIERYYFNLRNPKDLSQPHPIFNDIRVRKAIMMGMDRWSAVSGILQGYGEVAVTELDNHPWANTDLEPVPYDPEAAKALLDEAGWVPGSDGIRVKDGQRLSFRHSTTAGNQVRENLQLLFQQNLKDIGVEMVIDNYQSSTLFGGCSSDGIFGTGNFDIIGFTNSPASIDLAQEWSDYFLSTSIKDCETNPAGSNAWGYSNPALDEKMQCALNELDPDVRVQCIKDAQKIIYDDYFVLYVYDRLDVFAISDRVQGVNPTIFGGHSYSYANWHIVGE
ncbi:MAG: peptide ABC transporter substrate-binding protein [Anaerolineales bacterium]